MNRYRQRWNELLNEEPTPVKLFIMQWCDQKASEIEWEEFIQANRITIKGTPINPQAEPHISGYLKIRFPHVNNQKLRIY